MDPPRSRELTQQTWFAALRRQQVLLPLLSLLLLGACSDFRAGQLMRTANDLGAQGHWEQALHYYERLWVEYPEHPKAEVAMLRAARINAGPEEKPRSAIDLYRDLVLNAKNEDTKVVALREMSEIYALSPDSRDQAVELHEIHLRRYPHREDSAEVRIRLANLYIDMHRYGQAIETATPLLESANTRHVHQAAVIIGQAQELAGYGTGALKYFDQVIASAKPGNEDWIAAMTGRIRILESVDRWPDAVDTARQLRDHHPNPDAIERWLIAILERREKMNR